MCRKHFPFAVHVYNIHVHLYIPVQYRLIMRREQVLKLACNHLMTPTMELTKMSTSETAWCWFAVDFSTNAPSYDQLAVRFKVGSLGAWCFNPLKRYLGNYYYYRVVRSKLVFYNVLATSIINTHIKRKNSKTICSSEKISSQIFGSAPNSPYTLVSFM
jgi:hypothetical protein